MTPSVFSVPSAVPAPRRAHRVRRSRLGKIAFLGPARSCTATAKMCRFLLRKDPAMSNAPVTPAQQPGLESLSKSFEPAALEAYWGPEWEKRGYGVAGFRGTGAPAGKGPGVCHSIAPAQRHRHPAHGPCLQPDHHGLVDALPPHVGPQHGCGFRAPTTRALPPKLWSSANCKPKASAVTTWGPTPAEARKNFVSKVWEWKEESGNTITSQMRRMGDSVDWSREYFTMDPKLSKTVTDTFVQLYQQGLIYRGKRLVNWDPVLMSAVSDLEVESDRRRRLDVAHPLRPWTQRAAIALLAGKKAH